jgi:AraC family transcriptional regulator
VRSGVEPVDVLGAFRSERFVASLSDYRDGLRQWWHSHEQPILTLILAGHAREQVGCEDATASPLMVGLKPAGLRHTDHFCHKGLRALRISLAESFVSEGGGGLHVAGRWDWVSGSQAVGPLLRLARCLRRGGSDETELTEHLYESLAGLLTTTPARPAPEAPPWLRRAREHLEASYQSGVRLTRLSREAGVHPVYFARQFRRFYGRSVGRYVRQLQFRAAASMLAERGADLAQVACRVGFSDQAHLTRTFAGEFGITPGQFRRIVS